MQSTQCYRYVYVLRKRENSSLRDSVTFPERKCQKVVRFRCKRSNGNVSKSHETANGNTGYPSCFRIGFTCFCDVSVYGFLEFRPELLGVRLGGRGDRASRFSFYPHITITYFFRGEYGLLPFLEVKTVS